jgi:hypothetical protein
MSWISSVPTASEVQCGSGQAVGPGRSAAQGLRPDGSDQQRRPALLDRRRPDRQHRLGDLRARPHSFHDRHPLGHAAHGLRRRISADRLIILNPAVHAQTHAQPSAAQHVPGRQRLGERPCLQFDQGYANNGPVSAYVRSHNSAHKIRSQIAWAKNLNSAMRPSSPSPTTIPTEWSQSQPAPVSASSSAAAAKAFAASSRNSAALTSTRLLPALRVSPVANALANVQFTGRPAGSISTLGGLAVHPDGISVQNLAWAMICRLRRSVCR